MSEEKALKKNSPFSEICYQNKMRKIRLLKDEEKEKNHEFYDVKFLMFIKINNVGSWT